MEVYNDDTFLFQGLPYPPSDTKAVIPSVQYSSSPSLPSPLSISTNLSAFSYMERTLLEYSY